MKLLRSKDDLREFVSTNDIALVCFTRLNSYSGKHIERVLLRLESRVGHMINFAIIDVSEVSGSGNIIEDENLGSLPLIRLYLKGKNIFEQEDCFMDFQTDYYVLRISVRDVLRQYGINLTFK